MALSTFNANAPMDFAPAQEAPLTKTPANVKANHFDSDDTVVTPKSTKKRKIISTRDEDRIAAAALTNVIIPEKKSRRTKSKVAQTRIIPRSFAECEPADQELITMRDAGAEWKAIRARWKEITGEPQGHSTLPNRYARLKSNFTVIRQEDNALLLEAKRSVEEAFEKEKWNLIARSVVEKGGDNYAAIVLQRQYKKLMVAEGAFPPQGILDSDFHNVKALGEEDDQ